MKILVVYDSLYGNTEQVAKSIAVEMTSHEVNILLAKNTSQKDIESVDLLFAGSPRTMAKLRGE
jgi:flavodoxin